MSREIEKCYDMTSVAQSQATIDSLNQNPIELQLLEALAAKLTPGSGTICDLGCGVGQVARFFHDCGFDSIGVDLSAGMLKEARKHHPGVKFAKANMKKLPFKDGELAAIVGFYSLCHIPRWEVPSVLTELKRALRPSGLLLLAYHLGRGTFYRTESWGKAVSLESTLFSNLEVQEYVGDAGFKTEGIVERQPDATGGARGYLWALKPDDKSNAALPLHQAVLIGSTEDVEQQLARGVSPNLTLNGCTPLHLAAGDGRLQIMKLLLEAGAEVDRPFLSGGGTALYIAVQMGQFKAAKRLLEAGADPGTTDYGGNTLLHLACTNGRADIVNWLIQLGLDPSAYNNQAETPAMWAKRSGFDALATRMGAANPTD